MRCLQLVWARLVCICTLCEFRHGGAGRGLQVLNWIGSRWPDPGLQVLWTTLPAGVNGRAGREMGCCACRHGCTDTVHGPGRFRHRWFQGRWFMGQMVRADKASGLFHQAGSVPPQGLPSWPICWPIRLRSYFLLQCL